MVREVKYKSKPLDCWNKLMELDEQHSRDLATAKERGELLVLGASGCSALLAGLGDFQVITYSPSGPEMKELELLGQYNDVASTYGFGSECCAVTRLSLGSIIANNFGWKPEAKGLKPDFLFDVPMCQQMLRFMEFATEHYNLPSMTLEPPIVARASEYLVDQFQESIEWLEKVTGREYNDERLIEGVTNEWDNRVLHAKLCEFQKAIPAPLDLRSLAVIEVSGVLGMAHRREMVDFYRIVLDEVQDRVHQQIAALATERCRLMHEGAAPWYTNKLFRYPKKYGAVFMASLMYFIEPGAWEVGPDYSMKPAKTPKERGISLKTREDALRSLAELYTTYFPRRSIFDRVGLRLKLAEDWHVDGVVYALDKYCMAYTAVAMESVMALKEKGVPSITYETNSCDPRELREWEYQARMDAFLESLGLRPLE